MSPEETHKRFEVVVSAGEAGDRLDRLLATRLTDYSRSRLQALIRARKVTRDGVAIATAMTFESDGVASVQWVGTISSARGSGLGTLVTTHVTNAAFERGASSCTLQASRMGEPIYRALGYETIYHYAEYVRWPKPPSSS